MNAYIQGEAPYLSIGAQCRCGHQLEARPNDSGYRVIGDNFDENYRGSHYSCYAGECFLCGRTGSLVWRHVMPLHWLSLRNVCLMGTIFPRLYRSTSRDSPYMKQLPIPLMMAHIDWAKKGSGRICRLTNAVPGCRFLLAKDSPTPWRGMVCLRPHGRRVETGSTLLMQLDHVWVSNVAVVMFAPSCRLRSPRAVFCIKKDD